MSFENVVFTTRQNGASEIMDMKQPNNFSVIHKIEKLLANEESLKTLRLKKILKRLYNL